MDGWMESRENGFHYQKEKKEKLLSFYVVSLYLRQDPIPYTNYRISMHIGGREQQQ